MSTGPIIPTLILLFPLNTQVIEVAGVMDAVNGGFLNNGSGAATLLDFRGNADAVINNLPLAYVAASNGIYQGVVPDAFNASLGSGYTLQIKVTAGAIQALWSIPALVKLRTQ